MTSFKDASPSNQFAVLYGQDPGLSYEDQELKEICSICENNLRIRMQRFIEEHLRARALRIRNARREAATTAWETQVMDHAESMRQLLNSHLEGETEMSPFDHIAFDPEHLKFLESGGYESGQGFG